MVRVMVGGGHHVTGEWWWIPGTQGCPMKD